MSEGRGARLRGEIIAEDADHTGAFTDDFAAACPTCGAAMRVVWYGNWGVLACPAHGPTDPAKAHVEGRIALMDVDEHVCIDEGGYA